MHVYVQFTVLKIVHDYMYVYLYIYICINMRQTYLLIK